MGLVFTLSGAFGLFFAPNPTDLPPDLLVFMKQLESWQYFLPLLKSTELVCGLMLLSGLFVPLALVVLAPIILNILLVHIYILTDGLPIAIILTVFEFYLAFFSNPYSTVIKLLLEPK